MNILYLQGVESDKIHDIKGYRKEFRGGYRNIVGGVILNRVIWERQGYHLMKT